MLYYSLLAFTGVYAIYIHSRALFPYETSNSFDDAIIIAIHIAMFVAIPCLVYLSRHVRNTRTIKILGLLGALTYPLYLLHQRIGNILIVLIVHHSAFAWANVVMAMELFMVICALLLALIEPKIRHFLLVKMTPVSAQPDTLSVN